MCAERNFDESLLSDVKSKRGWLMGDGVLESRSASGLGIDITSAALFPSPPEWTCSWQKGLRLESQIGLSPLYPSLVVLT